MSEERLADVPPDSQIPTPEVGALEEALGIRFVDQALACLALIHKSLTNDYGRSGIYSNERLEFLGDAVVGASVAELLYDRFPERDEGELTLLRSALVRASSLAGWARDLGLNRLVLVGRGEARAGGLEREPLLASAFEAVVGAVYLDQGRDAAFQLVHSFTQRQIAGWAEAPVLDPKSRLQQVSQAHYAVTPTYEVLSVAGEGHSPTFTIEVTAGLGVKATATGRSKQAAQQAAATQALILLGEIAADATEHAEPAPIPGGLPNETRRDERLSEA